MKKKTIVILFIIIFVLCAGCKGATEPSDLAIVSGIGIDKSKDGDIIVSLLIPVTKFSNFGGLLTSGSGQKESTVLLSEKGESVMAAYRKIEQKLSRKVFFSQNEAVFIGERLAKEGISGIIDFFHRHPESHLRAYVFFTKGEASEILRMHSTLERNIVEKYIKQEKLETGFKVMLKDFLNMISESGIETTAALAVVKPLEVGNPSEAITGGLDGAAVLHHYKLVGWMTAEEARGALWLRNEIKRGVITTNVPDEKDSGKVSVEIVKSKTKVNPIINSEGIYMEVNVYMKGRIYENSSKLDLTKPEVVGNAERLISEEIKKNIQFSLDKVQKQLKSDVYGFGAAMYRKYPKEWNSYYKDSWDEAFPAVKVKITCQVKISEIGLGGKTLIQSSDQ